MKTGVQTYLFKLFSVLTVASLLAAALGMFATQPASAAGIVGTITHPGFLPNVLALDETRNRLFVFDRATGSIFVYNATTLEELGSVETTLEDSASMVIDESAGKLYVGYFGPGVDLADGIAVINTATTALIEYLPSGGYTYLVEDEALNVVYASSNYYGVRKIDVATDGLSTVGGITANLYTSMAVNPVTHELFVSNWSQNDGKFFIVNPATLAVTTIPSMNGFGVAVNWTENKVYVSYCQPAGWEAVCILDRDTNTRTDVHTTNDSTYPMVFNPSVNRMYTNTEVNRIATIFNGSTDAFTNVELTGALATVNVRHSTDNVYYVNAAGTYVMKGSTGKIVAEFPADGECSVCDGAIVINQTSGLVYVINDDSVGKVTVIQDGTFTSSCTVTPLAGAGTTAGALTSTDCHSPLRNEPSYWDPYFADRYAVNLTAGQQVSITLDGGTAYEYIYLLAPSGNTLAEASGDYFSAARIPNSGLFTVSVSGTYIIEVTSVYSGLENGSFADSEWPYTLTLNVTNPASQTLTVSKTGTGSGTITSSPAGINCGPTCSYNFNYSASVTLTASAGSDSTFTGWSGACTGAGACFVTMNASRSVTASFAFIEPTFVDVPYSHMFWKEIEAFYDAGITTGCSQSPRMYCPNANVTRAEMAVFLERAMGNFAPTPSSTGMFSDVLGTFWASKFIEEFYNDGITTGCANNPLRYCPNNNVTRQEMAVFIERALGNFTPNPNPSGNFSDVPYPGMPSTFPAFIDQFYNDGITTGCAKDPLRYCPLNLVTRQEMAVFIVRAFGIPLP